MKSDRTGSPDTSGGQPQEQVEDRPRVSEVHPEDYPAADRENSRPDRPAGLESPKD